LLALLAYQGQMTLTGGVAPRRMGNAHPSIVPYQTFPSQDGWINVGVGNEGLWAKFCPAIGRKELLEDARYTTNRDRVENRESLIASLSETFQTKPTAEWQELLTTAGVPVGAIREVPEALEDARSDSRGMITTVEHPEAGPLTMVGNPVKMGEIGYDPSYLPPPRLGEHSEAILADVGYSTEEIAGLRSEGVI